MWNRSAPAAEELRAAGGRWAPAWDDLVRGHLVVHMGTTAPSYSEALARDVVRAGGPVPSGLLMKLAVNLYLVTTVSGLVEAYHFAEQRAWTWTASGGRRRWADVEPDHAHQAGQVPRRGLHGAGGPQGRPLQRPARHAAAREAGVATPLADSSEQLFAEAERLGYGGLDMAGVPRAFEARSAGVTSGRRAESSP